MIGDTLAELAVKIKADSTELTKNLDDADKKMGSFSEKFLANSKKIGMGMTVAGAAITSALGMTVKAAADEQVGIERLRVAIENTGLTYEGATGGLEKWINATQQATAFADDQQREALSSLIPLTNDVAKAQELLGVAMDVARWKGLDLTTASELLMKVYAGDMGMLKRYGIIVTEGATATEALAEIQKIAAGQAETYAKTAAGGMELLKNNMGDVMEGIGDSLIPLLTDLFKAIQPTLESIKTWISENPELTKTIVIVIAAIGGLLTILGPLLIILPGIIAALPILGGVIGAISGPVLIAIGAIAALVAIGILVWKNWDKISQFFTDMWKNLSKTFNKYGAEILAAVFPIVGIPLLIAKHWDTIKDTAVEAWDNVTGTIKSAIESVISWLDSHVPKINWSRLGEGAGVNMAAIFSALNGAWASLSNWFSSHMPQFNWSQMWGNMGNIWANITSLLAIVWSNFTSWVSSHMPSIDWAGIWSGLSTAWSTVSGYLTSLWNSITTWFSTHVPDFTSLWQGVLTAWNNLKSFSLESIKGLLNSVISAINTALNWINLQIIYPISNVTIGGWRPFGFLINYYLTPLSYLAEGGIITSPTMAMIGEAGPEAVIPLDKAGIGGVHIHLDNPIFLGNESDARQLAGVIESYLRQNQRLLYGGALA